MASDDERPIIVKRIKKVEGGAHGGAWKVAYADFVTAMMAFFLLLWLLSSASESQLEGIADYFTPTVGIRDEMGIGFEGGESAVKDGTKRSKLMPAGIVFGAPPTGEIVKTPDQIKKEYEEETQEFEKLEQALKDKIEDDPDLGEFQDNLLIEQTPEGLRIQLIDQDDRSMFKPGSARLQEYAKAILSKLTPILDSLPNRMSIAGHTDAVKFGINRAYTNWELSADRANSTRRYFRDHTDLSQGKVVVVHGKAYMEPLVPQDRTDPRNRRISMVLLRKSIYPYDVPITDELNKPPTPEDAANPKLDLGNGFKPFLTNEEAEHTPEVIPGKSPLAPEPAAAPDAHGGDDGHGDAPEAGGH